MITDANARNVRSEITKVEAAGGDPYRDYVWKMSRGTFQKEYETLYGVAIQYVEEDGVFKLEPK